MVSGSAIFSNTSRLDCARRALRRRDRHGTVHTCIKGQPLLRHAFVHANASEIETKRAKLRLAQGMGNEYGVVNSQIIEIESRMNEIKSEVQGTRSRFSEHVDLIKSELNKLDAYCAPLTPTAYDPDFCINAPQSRATFDASYIVMNGACGHGRL